MKLAVASRSTTPPPVARLSSRPFDAEGGLTRRERDVLYRVACGGTDREIAGQLGISPRTVHKHLEHVYQKLGVATRTAAVMRIVDRLLEPPR